MQRFLINTPTLENSSCYKEWNRTEDLKPAVEPVIIDDKDPHYRKRGAKLSGHTDSSSESCLHAYARGNDDRASSSSSSCCYKHADRKRYSYTWYNTLNSISWHTLAYVTTLLLISCFSTPVSSSLPSPSMTTSSHLLSTQPPCLMPLTLVNTSHPTHVKSSDLLYTYTWQRAAQPPICQVQGSLLSQAAAPPDLHGSSGTGLRLKTVFPALCLSGGPWGAKYTTSKGW
jgi:hypothetical protein